MSERYVRLCSLAAVDRAGMLLFEEQAHICSLCDDWLGTKGVGLSEGAYMLVILSISIMIVFASLLVLSCATLGLRAEPTSH